MGALPGNGRLLRRARTGEHVHLTIALYAFIERRPDRAVPCLSHIFDDHGTDSGPLDDHEGRLVLELKPAMVAPAPEDQQPEVDPASFASLPRRFTTPPGASEVANALREGLVPRDVHVIRWRPLATDAPDFEDTDPRRYLDDAMAGLGH